MLGSLRVRIDDFLINPFKFFRLHLEVEDALHALSSRAAKARPQIRIPEKFRNVFRKSAPVLLWSQIASLVMYQRFGNAPGRETHNRQARGLRLDNHDRKTFSVSRCDNDAGD